MLGRWGESLAADYLRNRGYRLLGANWRCRFGEIDLIVEKGGFLVFVEVKLRKDHRFAQAREFVDGHKQQRLLLSAQMYLSQNSTGLQPRFDVVEIYAPEGTATRNPKIVHTEDAFQ